MELMIVVAIIGILSSVAIPSFTRFQCKSKQSEAQVILNAVHMTQLAYNGEHATYLPLAHLTSYGGLDPRSIFTTKYYTITIPTATMTAYTAQAQDTKLRLSSRTGTDTWTVQNTFRGPVNLTNQCR